MDGDRAVRWGGGPGWCPPPEEPPRPRPAWPSVAWRERRLPLGPAEPSAPEHQGSERQEPSGQRTSGSAHAVSFRP